jgi:hypothetical protein
MRKHLLTLALFTPISAMASGIHLSPEIKFGPYIGSGLSGGGLQLGVSDVLGLDALYVSYSHISSQMIKLQDDRLKTYRIGTQYQITQSPKMAFQVEAGIVEYEGVRYGIWGDHRIEREGKGVSLSASYLIHVNPNVGFRFGGDINIIDEDKTLFGTPVSSSISTGVVFNF